MAAVDFFSSFGYQWAQGATSYGWDDAQWKNGWLSIGSTPPSVGQFDAVQKITDLKLKYVFDAINSIATSGGLALTSANASSLSSVLYRNATTSLRGMMILASAAEVQTGTEATKAVTSSTLNSRTATETRTGLVELATPAEVIAGTDATRAVTPAGLAANVASTTNAGITTLATAAEVQAGSEAAKVVTPAALSARTATTTRTGLAQLATDAEVQAGTVTDKTVTPSGLSSRTATEARSGIASIASDAETLAGTLDTKMTTPKKVANYVSAKSIGIAQTWQDVTASRVAGTTYTNSTGRPIFVAIMGNRFAIGGGNLQIAVSGLIVQTADSGGEVGSPAPFFCVGALVPPGASYYATSSPGINSWKELR